MLFELILDNPALFENFSKSFNGPLISPFINSSVSLTLLICNVEFLNVDSNILISFEKKLAFLFLK